MVAEIDLYTQMNDTLGKTFNEIADTIEEKHLKGPETHATHSE